jgi:hypothetical protein
MICMRVCFVLPACCLMLEDDHFKPSANGADVQPPRIATETTHPRQ